MSQSQEHEHLLKHPVITSFLWRKWSRIGTHFNRALRFEFMYVCMLSWYIFQEFAVLDCKKDWLRIASFFLSLLGCIFWLFLDIWNDFKILKTLFDHQTKTVMRILYSNGPEIFFFTCLFFIYVSQKEVWDGLLTDAKCKEESTINSYAILTLQICTVLLAISEVYQVVVLRAKWFSWKNTCDVLFIGMVSYILFDGSQYQRNLAAFAIVFSWILFINAASRHPKLMR